MDITALTRLVRSLRKPERPEPWRKLLLLKGDPQWVRRAAANALQAADLHAVPWIGGSAANGTEAIPLSKATGLLGREFDGLVLDLSEGICPDALGACAGTVRAGGLLLLLLDPAGAAARDCPRFLQRLLRELENSPGTACFNQTGAQRLTPVPAQFPEDDEGDLPPPPCRTRDQAEAVAAVQQLVQGHRRRPLVLVADRGRGKSAALGIAAARLLLQGCHSILLTGPRLDAVLPVLEHAAALLPDAERGRGHLRLGSRSLEFVPPDALLLGPRQVDLLLVDEAAAIPPALLEQLLNRHSRIAFATTIHGYEGTGRGFAVRFRRTLDRLTPDWRELRMEKPIRWAVGDPLEETVFRALLLNAAAVEDAEVARLDSRRCEYRKLQRDRLANDEALLGQVFGLLVLAHYRTRPRDLLHLLDGEGLSVHILQADRRVLATVLATDEGGLDADTAYQVSLGRRRLHGHLLPQTLSQHLGLETAATLRLRRVIRIAVHPALQGRGLGTRLLRELQQDSLQAGLDGCGASFGADLRLLGFWQRAGFAPVRLGVSRETSSGSHSANLLLPLSAAGQALFDTARQRFMAHFPHMLGDALRDLEPSLALALMAAGPARPRPDFSAQDRLDLVAFGFGHRRYEVCPAPLRRLAESALSDSRTAELLKPEQQALLLARMLQNRPWKQCADLLGLSGRKAAESLLREGIAFMLEQFCDTDISGAIEKAKQGDTQLSP